MVAAVNAKSCHCTVGSILGNSLEQIVTSLKEAAEKADITAGCLLEKGAIQSYMLISSLEGALRDKLTLKKADANVKTQALMHDVNMLVNRIKAGVKLDQDFLEISYKIEEVVKGPNAPLFDIAQIEDVQPHFIDTRSITGSTDDKVEIVFKGTFPYGNRDDCSTFVFCDGKEYRPVDTSKKEIRFKVDRPPADLNKHVVQYLIGKLKLHYKPSWYSWAIQTYNTIHGIRPNSLGAVTIIEIGRSKVYDLMPYMAMEFPNHYKTAKPEWVNPPNVEQWVTLSRLPKDGGAFVCQTHSPNEGTGEHATFRIIYQTPVVERTPARWDDEWTIKHHPGYEPVYKAELETFDGVKESIELGQPNPHFEMRVVDDGQLVKIKVKQKENDKADSKDDQ